MARKPNGTAEFWEKVLIIPFSDCWIWTDGCNGHGYGSFRLRMKTFASHRFSYQIHYGSIPKGMCVCHKCDNRRCVRPDHLFLGTVQDNTDDKMKKGRDSCVGERNHFARLNKETIAEIKKDLENGATKKEVMKKFSISQTHAYGIASGERWKHI